MSALKKVDSMWVNVAKMQLFPKCNTLVQAGPTENHVVFPILKCRQICGSVSNVIL